MTTHNCRPSTNRIEATVGLFPWNTSSSEYNSNSQYPASMDWHHPNYPTALGHTYSRRKMHVSAAAATQDQT
jgi:hypothetical protein